jgi:hypothetical protein
LPEGDNTLSLSAALLLLSNNQSPRSSRLLSAGGGEAHSAPGQLDLLTNVEDTKDGEPEAWRVEAVVDFLHQVYRLSPEELSEVLRRTAGWKIAPREIDKIMLGTASRKPRFSERRRVTVAFPDPQPDEAPPRPERD